MEKIKFIPKNNAVHDIYAKIGIPFPAGLTEGDTPVVSDYLYVENITDTRGVFVDDVIGGNNYDLNYSFDKETWTPCSGPVRVEPHTKIWLKGINEDGFSKAYNKYTRLVIDFNANVGGDITSLLFGDNFKEETNVSAPRGCFAGLFMETKIVSATELDFSRITAVDDDCFWKMFAGNDLLVGPPRLDRCVCTAEVNTIPFSQMFRDCPNLAVAYFPTIINPVAGYGLGTQNWLNGAAETGNLYCREIMADQIESDSVSGCPTGWTKHII